MADNKQAAFLNGVKVSTITVIKDGARLADKPETFEQLQEMTAGMSGKGNFLAISIPVPTEVSDTGFAQFTRTAKQVFGHDRILDDGHGHTLLNAKGEQIKRNEPTRCNILLGTDPIVLSVAKATGEVTADGKAEYKNESAAMLPGALISAYRTVTKEYAASKQAEYEASKAAEADGKAAEEDVLPE